MLWSDFRLINKVSVSVILILFQGFHIASIDCSFHIRISLQQGFNFSSDFSGRREVLLWRMVLEGVAESAVSWMRVSGALDDRSEL